MIVENLPTSLSPADALERCWDLPYCCLMESALRSTVEGASSYGQSSLGRYSFLAVDPFDLWQVPRRCADPFGDLSRKLSQYQQATLPGLPPFQGGAAGILSYEFGRCLERIPKPQHDEFRLPLAVMGLYDLVIALGPLSQ